MFGAHQSFVYKLLCQKRERGDIAPWPHGGSAQAKLDEDQLLILIGLVAKTPDATLDELRAQIKKQTRVEVSVPTIWRALDALGLSRKKSIRAAEADPAEQARFAKTQKKLAVERLVFVDEFDVNTAMTRTHARSPRGERAQVTEPFNRGSNISVISSLSLPGVGAMSVEGAVDTLVFNAFVKSFLVLTLLGDDIVLLGNVKFHYSERAINLIEAAGASILHLPARLAAVQPNQRVHLKDQRVPARGKGAYQTETS